MSKKKLLPPCFCSAHSQLLCIFADGSYGSPTKIHRCLSGAAAGAKAYCAFFFNRFIIFIIRRKKMLVARPRCSLNRSQTMCPRRLWRCAFAALVLRTTQNTQSALASINSTVKSKKGKYIVGYYPEMS
ncbi:MAG: hypothetical protein GKR88_21370 [Flavobacteriaceae bacterium]|nr:MAG: hypothetical protein GKR88_00065 [Flavobacteriaceae bacterium]QMU63552.1 MAG: hypothetical protein GKR88_04180 [Flavobacteriaceae bacterium]QMU65721.1 MAG: hypothetical protein GKR88_16510 [Flavobacteriaceae bacterium]QMU66204.1 MAG: hypothetical protein GKR88_19260 [Flavobacteriaceae bacterium]QMU66216.1 MAG: hypothetical protein GKR88_19325 [Flavobacteriaceae bacterium]